MKVRVRVRNEAKREERKGKRHHPKENVTKQVIAWLLVSVLVSSHSLKVCFWFVMFRSIEKRWNYEQFKNRFQRLVVAKRESELCHDLTLRPFRTCDVFSGLFVAQIIQIDSAVVVDRSVLSGFLVIQSSKRLIHEKQAL